jgi:molybdate transport system ATP-binding protein
VVIDATIGAIDETWHLARVDFAGGNLWTRDHNLPVGKKVRVRVLARDVSLTLDDPGRSSIQNVHPATVEAIAADDHPANQLVRVTLGETRLLSRLTRRAVEQLGIAPGLPVRAQVKSVALME